MAKSWISETKIGPKYVQLVYDTLTLDEAKKLLDVICSDEIMPVLDGCYDVKLTYDVNRINDRWCRDLVLWIKAPYLPLNDEEKKVRFLASDKKELERIQQFIKDRTGII